MTSKAQRYSPETLMMSHGYDPFLSEGAIKPPIFMTSTFAFRTAEEGEQYFKWAYGLEARERDQTMGLIYSRLNNPGIQILEERLALWDKAEMSLGFASGMAAISTSILAHAKPGDVVLYSMPVYGGTEYLLEKILPKFGIETRSFPADMPLAEVTGLIGELADRLAIVYLESPANPTNTLIDIAGIAKAAKAARSGDNPVLTFVDNTFLGPIYQKPLTLGADLVLYSATKYLSGHSDVIAGAVSGSQEVIEPIGLYRTITGSMPDPFTCWLLLRSLETLKIRMETQAASARQIARFLQAHANVDRVFYPELLESDSPQRAIFQSQCTGPGAIVSFEIKGSKAEAFRFLNSVKLCKLAVSLGGTESLVEHPSTMTHSDIPLDVQQRYGITDRLIRLSVGVENPADLMDDLGQALDLSQATPPACYVPV